MQKFNKQIREMNKKKRGPELSVKGEEIAKKLNDT